MTGETVEYYLDILKRVRKGKPPVDEVDIYQELLAFDFVYSLSLLYAREHAGVDDPDLELVWSDSMLLDCGKLAQLLAHEMAADEAWDEVKGVFEPFVVKRIEEFSNEVETADEEVYNPPVGGFAFSEYVRFKEMLDYLYTYRGARKSASHERLMRTMADLLLGRPTANGLGDGDL